MEAFARLIGLIIGVAAIGALIIAVITYPTMLLWNWLMPVIFGLPSITFWQALGLLILSSFLFRSTGGHSSK